METRTWTEAPASATLRFNLQGYDVMFTLRGESGNELLPKVTAAIKHLDGLGAQAGNGHKANGNGNGNAPTCPTHGSPMKKSQHGSGYYCPQKVAESGGGQDGSKPIYCKAKA